MYRRAGSMSQSSRNSITRFNFWDGKIIESDAKFNWKKAKALMLEHLKYGIDDLYADNDDILNNDENSDIGEFDNFSQLSK